MRRQRQRRAFGRCASPLFAAAAGALLLVPAPASQSETPHPTFQEREGATVLVNGLELPPADRPASPELLALLARAAEHTVVHLLDDDAPEHAELLHRARASLIARLRDDAGFSVLVLPVGIYEGWWVDQRLREGASAERAAEPLYRVWRESESFIALLESLRPTTGAAPFEMIGSLSRYHATGKESYAGHLEALLQELGLLEHAALPGYASGRDAIRSVLGGRDRLAAATAEHRAQAEQLVSSALAAIGAPSLHRTWGAERLELEQQFLRNWLTFVELERIRAGEVAASPDFGEREKAQNLRWFLQKRYPSRKLVWWEGRGDGDAPLPTRAPGLRLHLTIAGDSAVLEHYHRVDPGGATSREPAGERDDP